MRGFTLRVPAHGLDIIIQVITNNQQDIGFLGPSEEAEHKTKKKEERAQFHGKSFIE
jgi:hypothetical protein